MPAEARRNAITQILSHAVNGVVSVNALALQLGVSEMTIRRDLDWLAERAALRRVHGGAMINPDDGERPFGDRLDEAGLQKKSIGWAAAQLVQDGDRIILDAGTTTRQITPFLLSKKNLTVITNNIPIAAELARSPHIETILLGGTLKHQELCTVGPLVKQSLSVLSVDKLFLSTAGFSIPGGVTDPDLREAEVKQAMIQAARQVILVADSSKYGFSKLVRVCPLQAVHAIVTDDDLPPQAVSELEAVGVQLLNPRKIETRSPQDAATDLPQSPDSSSPNQENA